MIQVTPTRLILSTILSLILQKPLICIGQQQLNSLFMKRNPEMGYRFYVQNLLNEIEAASLAGLPLTFEPHDVQELYQHLCFLEESITAISAEGAGNG